MRKAKSPQYIRQQMGMWTITEISRDAGMSYQLLNYWRKAEWVPNPAGTLPGSPKRYYTAEQRQQILDAVRLFERNKSKYLSAREKLEDIKPKRKGTA